MNIHIINYFDSLSRDSNLINTITMPNGERKDFYVDHIDREEMTLIWAECSYGDPEVFVREVFDTQKSNADELFGTYYIHKG